MGQEEKVQREENFLIKGVKIFAGLIVKPVVWVRENIVEPNQQEYYWYHERLPRVPTVDQCYMDDYACVFEAQKQFARDKMVERNIIQILKKRYEHCRWENIQNKEGCKEFYDNWQKALTNFFIKYGELGLKDSVITCFMKQKHRMAFERRHGTVGSGRKTQENHLSESIKAEEEF